MPRKVGEPLFRRRREASSESNVAPEPEGPEEIYRRFERLNRRGFPGGHGGLRELAGGAGKKTLYATFAVVEVAAIVLGLFLDVPFMDVVAFVLPGLLLMLNGGSKDEGPDESGSEAEPAQESLQDRLRNLLEDQDATKSGEWGRTGGNP